MNMPTKRLKEFESMAFQIAFHRISVFQGVYFIWHNKIWESRIDKLKKIYDFYSKEISKWMKKIIPSV